MDGGTMYTMYNDTLRIRYFEMAQVSADNSSGHTFAHHERNTNEFVEQTFLHASSASKVDAGWEKGKRLMVDADEYRITFHSSAFACNYLALE